MREKLMSLSVAVIRDMAKEKGIKGVTTKKKSELVEAILELEESKEATEEEEKEEKKEEQQENKRDENIARIFRGDITEEEKKTLDSGITADGILEVMSDGYGFIRCANYLPGDNDVYVSPSQIRRFNLKTGDIITGKVRVRTQNEKFGALLYLTSINGRTIEEAAKRKNFEDLTPIFPNERLRMETANGKMSMRILDLISPIGKGQRGMIVSPP